MRNGGWAKTIATVAAILATGFMIGGGLWRLASSVTMMKVQLHAQNETNRVLGVAVEGLKDAVEDSNLKDQEQDGRLDHHQDNLRTLKHLHGLSWFEGLGDSITLERPKGPVEPGSWVPGGTE